MGLGVFVRCVSRSAMWMPLIPSFCASFAHCSWLSGMPVFTFVSRAISRIACFTNQETMPGLAPQQETAVGPPGFFLRSAITASRSM